MEINWDDNEIPTNRQRTQRVLVTVAIVPWLIIIAVLITQRSTPTPPLQPHATVDETAADNTSDGHGEPPPATGPALTTPASAPPEPTTVTPGLPRRTEIKARALMLASEYLRDPTWSPDDLTVEQLAVEHVDPTSPSVVIVTVVANYRTPTKTGMFRIAVPVVPDKSGDLSVLPLYPLPSPPDTADLPDLSHLTPLASHEPALAALEAAGYEDITALDLLGAPGWPALAVITQRMPNGDNELAVLLHETADGYVVAGSQTGQKADDERLSEVPR